MAVILPAIVNSSCVSIKALPESHLLYEILPESTGQECLSCPSLTRKQFTRDVALPTVLLFALYQTFFKHICFLHTHTKMPVHYF